MLNYRNAQYSLQQLSTYTTQWAKNGKNSAKNVCKCGCTISQKAKGNIFLNLQ